MSSPGTSSPTMTPQSPNVRTSRNLGLHKSGSGFFSVGSGSTRPGSFYNGASSRASSFILNTSAYTRPFKSRRIDTVNEKAWLQKRHSGWRKAGTIIPLIGLFFFLVIIGLMAYTGWHSYDTEKFCPYWEDDFSSGQLDSNVWSHEVQLGGFGTGEFEQTTTFSNNSYIENGKLVIMPTVSWYNGFDNYTLNLTSSGECTSVYDSDCAALNNATSGSILPPVQSARLNTRKGANIRYGKVEVTARLPVGDWLWPAIWMMPTKSVYGGWPMSGEIDIMESRGNGHNYYTVDGGNPGVDMKLKHYPAGNNAVGSTLHWGADSSSNKFYKTTNGWHYPSNINGLTDGFHTYGMEWTPRGIRMFVDHELTQIVYFKFPDSGFWNWGEFASNIINPWFGGTKATPFDQEFYLILNVAVGGTNGYFADNVDTKPWTNGLTRDQAMTQFLRAKERWLPTWGEGTKRALVVDKVKMYKPCNMMK
ncbi:hypothetical protein PYCC9005_004094 [Savitreella phatthalungensis]